MKDGSKMREQLVNHRQAADALQESDEKFHALMESAPMGIIVIDSSGQIVMVNVKGQEIFGYERDELLGQPLEILLPEHLQSIHIEHRANYLAAPRQRTMGWGLELGGRRKDGTEFPVEIGLSYVEAKNGILVISFVIDITERRQMEEALRQHAADLEARNKELDAYGHTVAHDLKNPLSLIIGYSDLLEEDCATMPVDELREYLRMIARSGRKMVNIIDTILLLSSLREADAEMITPLDMAHIVAEVRDRLAYMIGEYQAELAIPNSWPVALGYGPWIEEVWANYISNALKYGGSPPRIELGATEQDDNTVRFWVRDHGPGLKPEEQARLFTPFTRLDQAHPKGHGLGLSIVQRIVEKLGGQVGVESEVGQGSVFFFTLPVT